MLFTVLSADVRGEPYWPATDPDNKFGMLRMVIKKCPENKQDLTLDCTG